MSRKYGVDWTRDDMQDRDYLGILLSMDLFNRNMQLWFKDFNDSKALTSIVNVTSLEHNSLTYYITFDGIDGDVEGGNLKNLIWDLYTGGTVELHDVTIQGTDYLQEAIDERRKNESRRK